MRYAFLLLILFCVPAQAQDRVFRASSIDIEQNERLDSLEVRVSRLESPSVESLPPPAKVTTPPIETVKPVAQVVVRPAPVRQAVAQSARYALAELRSLIQRLRPGGWRGAVYADVSPRSAAKNHLVADHGFSWDQVNGLSQSEALILHDLAHGRQVSPMRTTRTTTTQTVQQYSSFGTQQSYNAGCANGQCSNQSRSYSRGTFPILRRIFR